MSARIDREAIARLHQQGLTGRHIAAQLGYSEFAVSRIRKELGVTPSNRMTPERKARIQLMLDDGWPWAEITRTEGASQDTLAHHFPGTQWTRQQAVEHGAVIRWNENLVHHANYAQTPRKNRAA
ncbi:hypothetical protein ACIQXM_01865 [Arthrobacter sp. NPDC097144]|uniref:hypothetical protein n=1 Tax=Arthrobacter sp. NPDC097144 TaxID=3363946 RepID=UPI0038296A0B